MNQQRLTSLHTPLLFFATGAVVAILTSQDNMSLFTGIVIGLIMLWASMIFASAIGQRLTSGVQTSCYLVGVVAGIFLASSLSFLLGVALASVCWFALFGALSLADRRAAANS